MGIYTRYTIDTRHNAMIHEHREDKKGASIKNSRKK